MDRPRSFVSAGRGLVLSLSAPTKFDGFVIILWRAPSAAEKRIGIQAKDMVAFVGSERGTRLRLTEASDDGEPPCVWLGKASFDIPEKSRAQLAAWLADLPDRTDSVAHAAASVSPSGATP